MRLTFDENPTTGYRWVIIKTEDAKIERLPFCCPDESSAPGTGGTQSFEVEVKRHPCTLVFEMRRSWESKEIKPVQKITVIVE